MEASLGEKREKRKLGKEKKKSSFQLETRGKIVGGGSKIFEFLNEV